MLSAVPAILPHPIPVLGYSPLAQEYKWSQGLGGRLGAQGADLNSLIDAAMASSTSRREPGNAKKSDTIFSLEYPFTTVLPYCRKESPGATLIDPNRSKTRDFGSILRQHHYLILHRSLMLNKVRYLV